MATGNVITHNGKKIILNRLMKSSPDYTPYDKFKIGEGDTTPTITDNDLEKPRNISVSDSGTATSTVLNHLIDNTKNFLSTVQVGYIVHNLTDDTQAYVTAINSNTDLTLDNDIIVSGETYEIGPASKNITTISFDEVSLTATSRCILLTTEAVGNYLTEFGIFNSDANPLMFSRAVHSPITKTYDVQVIYTQKDMIK